jgi:predicted AAA+ superfamily ATPase
MRTMSLLESEALTGACSLSSLLTGDRPVAALPAFGITDVIDLVVRGGWPGQPESGSPDMPGEYLRTLAETDVPHVDGSRKDPRIVMALLRSLARNSATVVTQKTLVADIGLGNNGKDPEVSRATLARYLTALDRLFVIEQLPAWSPQLRSRTRLRTSPKILLTDPSLAVAALRANKNTLLRDLETLGLIFESMCLRDLAVYAQSIGADLFHYQDNSGLEADAIIETAEGWGAIEIKLGAHQEDAAAATLLRLSEKMIAAGYPPPDFLAVITGTGATKVRADTVITASIGALGP